MAPNEAKSRRGIMIALDPGAPGRASLAIVECLLDRHERHLLGVALEDGELLAHARSRLATEVVLSGAARPLEQSRLERQLRAQSATIRRIFETEAARLGYSHAFKVLHGSLAAQLRAVASDTDMLVVELPSAVASHQAAWGMRIDQLSGIDLPAVLYARLGTAERRGVVAVVAEPGDVDTIVRMAGSLARGGQLALTVLLGERSGELERGVRAAIAAALAELPVHLRLLSPAEVGATALGRIAQASDARVLVAPARLTKSDPRFVRDLLRFTSCSVMLVNPARGGAQS